MIVLLGALDAGPRRAAGDEREAPWMALLLRLFLLLAATSNIASATIILAKLD